MKILIIHFILSNIQSILTMKSINILIVDWELIIAKKLAKKLKSWGYTVVNIVSSGLKAIETAIDTQVDLILMSIALEGDLDGINTVEKIRETHSIPVVYLSYLSDKNTLKRARKTNPTGYLIKPYRADELKTIIKSIFHDRNFIDEKLKQVKQKAKLATFKVKQIAHKDLSLPSVKDFNHQIKKDKYRDRLPQLSSEDARIVSTLEKEGVCITSLPELKLPHTKRLIQEMRILYPHLYTLSKSNNWRQGIPRLRKLLYTEMLFWGLGERLLNIVENYIGLPLLFHGVDLRRDSADAPLTDARHWHRDIDDERMVKVIVYLNNVGKTGGPYEYIPRSFTEQITEALNYKSGFVSDEAISAIIPSEQWQACTAKAGSIIITDPCNVFHRAKPAKRNRYSITFGYTSRIPKLSLSEFQLSRTEWDRITPQLSKRQIACLRRNKS